MYDRYVDETAEEVKEDEDKHDDVIVMEVVRKVADSVIKMFNTEADGPGNHPELGSRSQSWTWLYGWKAKSYLPRGWTVRMFTVPAAPVATAYQSEFQVTQLNPKGWKEIQILPRGWYNKFSLNSITSQQSPRGLFWQLLPIPGNRREQPSHKNSLGD